MKTQLHWSGHITKPACLSSLFLLSLCLLSLCIHSCEASVWPKPQSLQTSTRTMRLENGAAKFVFNITGHSSSILSGAVYRYAKLVFLDPAVHGGGAAYAEKWLSKVREAYDDMPVLSSLIVDVLSDNTTLSVDTDESYSFVISASLSAATLRSQTVFGALRGLETFAQLVACVDGQFYVNATAVRDFPRFKHRGYLLDTSRHWLPLITIMRVLDAMAYGKLNVLHWHIVDDQAFPYVSGTFPKLSGAGAYSPTHVYTQSDVLGVIDYAYNRGIRVVPEFDTPGHTQSWGKGYPKLLTQCYDSSGNPSGLGPMNPINDNYTFGFVKKLFEDVNAHFRDDYLHVGGDEVSFACWMSNPDVQLWMKQHNYTDYSMVEQFYETNLLQIAQAVGKKCIVWQEIFDNGLKVLPDTIIEVWKSGWQDEMARVTKAGHKAILSSPWYLNYISYGSDWSKYYLVEPTNFTGTGAQYDLIIGGEACMWGEYVDATNSVSRTFPRIYAVGERLWSAKDVRDVDDADVRLHNVRCTLLTRDIDAEPPNGPSFCEYEFQAKYSPPF